MVNEIFMEVLSLKLLPQWWGLSRGERARILSGLKEVEQQVSERAISLKSYASLSPNSSIIYWLSADDTLPLEDFRVSTLSALRGYADESVYFFSIYKPSPYTVGNFDPRGVLREKPLRYFVAYPMKKDVEWYLLPFNEREDIMREHIKVAREHPKNKGIKSYTTYSFGVEDYEFVVIYEIPSLPEWVEVVEKLREVRARKWITREEPIITGEVRDLSILYA
jgi:chlorite dismutase